MSTDPNCDLSAYPRPNREEAIRALGQVLWPHKGDVRASPPLRAQVEKLIDAYEALPKEGEK